jgi:cytidylate kinase
MIVAIDGPAGAGKSTVARRLAERLGFRYLDTGAMYRALAWLALQRGLDLEEEEELARLARAYPVSLGARGEVEIAGREVSGAIRRAEIDRAVPVVARHRRVRAVMRERQRQLAAEGDAVVEGRDIGTVVAPGAEVKVYLTAREEVRARRRLADRPEMGAEALASDLRLRDASDAALMQPAADAVLLDTSDLDVDEVVARIEALVRERLPA